VLSEICSAVRNQRRSLILRLPAELRNTIYTYAFKSANLHTDFAQSQSRTVMHSSIHDGISLRSACRQLRHKTTSYHYQGTALLLPKHFVRIQDPVRVVGQRCCAELRGLTVHDKIAMSPV
jgi:hypothetical protein